MGDRRHGRTRSPLPSAGVVLLLLVTACSGGVRGGASDLPGPLPAGVAFSDPPVGALTAPDFSAVLIDGTAVTASDLWDDRPVVLVFTASWCGRCRDVHRAAAEVVDAAGGAVGLLGVVTTDDAEGAQAYADALGVPHALAVADDRVWLGYAVREPPLVALVAPGGFILRGWPGGVEPEILARHIDGLLVEPPAGAG